MTESNSRTGVFTAFSLVVPAARVDEWKRRLVVLPESWPAEIETNTRYLPSFQGVLPKQKGAEIVDGEVHHPTSLEALLKLLPIAHSVKNGGDIEIDGYLSSHDEFLYWFEAFLFLCAAAASLGGSGSGAFFWDSECVEPVLFEIEVAGGKVSVHYDDPQNNQRMLEHWEPRFREWAKRRGA